jgi:hypothetical protein
MKKEHLNPKLNLYSKERMLGSYVLPTGHITQPPLPGQIRTLVDIVVFAHTVNRSVGLPIQTLTIPDPDPALFVSGFKDANKK